MPRCFGALALAFSFPIRSAQAPSEEGQVSEYLMGSQSIGDSIEIIHHAYNSSCIHNVFI